MTISLTLGEANNLLHRCGLNLTLDPQILARLQQRASLDRLYLNLPGAAAGDLGARRIVERLIADIDERPTQNVQCAQKKRDGSKATGNRLRLLNYSPYGSVPTTRKPSNPGSGNELPGIYVYGQYAALYIEADRTADDIPTLAISAANCVNSSQNNRQYGWNTDIRIQITREELPVIAAVLFGELPNCEYDGHGSHRTKGYSVANETDRIVIRVWAQDQKPARGSYRTHRSLLRYRPNPRPTSSATTMAGSLGNPRPRAFYRAAYVRNEFQSPSIGQPVNLAEGKVKWTVSRAFSMRPSGDYRLTGSTLPFTGGLPPPC